MGIFSKLLQPIKKEKIYIKTCKPRTEEKAIQKEVARQKVEEKKSRWATFFKK